MVEEAGEEQNRDEASSPPSGQISAALRAPGFASDVLSPEAGLLIRSLGADYKPQDRHGLHRQNLLLVLRERFCDLFNLDILKLLWSEDKTDLAQGAVKFESFIHSANVC